MWHTLARVRSHRGTEDEPFTVPGGLNAVSQVHADGLPNNTRQVSGQRLAVDRKRVELAN